MSAPSQKRYSAFAIVREAMRDHMGQVAVAFWLNAEDEAELICFRSVADHVEQFLRMASKADGLPVLG